jgi:hypothetical protein
MRLQTAKWLENPPAQTEKLLRSGLKRYIGLMGLHQHISKRIAQTFPIRKEQFKTKFQNLKAARSCIDISSNVCL